VLTDVSSDSSLHAAVQAISAKRGGWVLELLAWFRQELVPDPIQLHLPAEELRHADGRAWSVEVLQTERGGSAGRSRLTLVMTDAVGDAVERTQEFATFDEARVERDRLIAAMRSEAFAEARS
jgi:hypothetical protein